MLRKLVAVAGVSLALASAVFAQEKTGTRPGFSLEAGSAIIVLVRPEISVGEQSTGGLFEPNADWTAQAREQIAAALQARQGALGNTVQPHDEGAGGDAGVAVQYARLFGSLAQSVMEYQFFPGNRLSTKKRRNSFDWSLGADIKKTFGNTGANYALFVYTHDEYGSAGRKMLQAAGLIASAFGVPVGVTSGVHHGYAGLVDLATGDLVWLNADLAMGGDVRTPEGASRRVQQLLEGFPGRSAPGAAGGVGR